MIDPEKGYKPAQPSILLKISGTSDKKRLNALFFNDFCVPLNAWDRPGTRLGHGTSGTGKVF